MHRLVVVADRQAAREGGGVTPAEWAEINACQERHPSMQRHLLARAQLRLVTGGASGAVGEVAPATVVPLLRLVEPTEDES